MNYLYVKILLLVTIWVAYAYSSKLLLKKGQHDLSYGGFGIFKGSTTTIEKHPYLVIVTWKDHFHCAGTIITSSWVLVSGECVDRKPASELAVVVGSLDGVSGRKYKVVEIIIHPNYTQSLDYDYALVNIDEQFQWSDKVKQAYLPDAKLKLRSEVVIAGWGKSSDSDSELQEGTMRVLNRNKCGSLYSEYEVNFTDRIGCVYNKGKTTPCDGDWGAPVVVGYVVHYIFTAIAMEGECTKEALPAICALVYPAVPWIRNVTNVTQTTVYNNREE